MLLKWPVGCECDIYKSFELEGKSRSESGRLSIGKRGNNGACVDVVLRK